MRLGWSFAGQIVTTVGGQGRSEDGADSARQAQQPCAAASGQCAGVQHSFEHFAQHYLLSHCAPDSILRSPWVAQALHGCSKFRHCNMQSANALHPWTCPHVRTSSLSSVICEGVGVQKCSGYVFVLCSSIWCWAGS